MPDNVLKLTSVIVSSFLDKNQTSGTDLPALIKTVHAALTDATAPSPEPVPPQTPAVTVRRSITSDALLCMECGKSFKTLKRHIRTDHDLSPEAYRAKWGLPQTYPMVAPTYSAARSAMAKSVGLGSRGAAAPVEKPAATVSASAAPEVVVAPPSEAPRSHTRAAAQPKASAAKPRQSRTAKPAPAK